MNIQKNLLEKNISQLNILSDINLQNNKNIDLQKTLLSLEESKTNITTATYTHNDTAIFLHSKYDPLKEANRLCDSIKNNTFDCIILIGIGLGYTCKALKKTYSSIPILCIEFNPSLFLQLCSHWDYSNVLDGNTNTQMSIFVEPTIIQITTYLRQQGFNNPCVLQSPFAKSVFNGTDVQNLLTEIKTYKDNALVNFNTLNKFTKRWQSNIIKNFAEHIHTLEDNNVPKNISFVSLERLKNAFVNIPCLLCCAGPSFDLYISKLKELSQKMLVVAVDTIMPVLSANGIVPDFIFSVDPQYINSYHTNDLYWRTPQPYNYIIDISTQNSVLRHAQKNSNFFVSQAIIPLGESLSKNLHYNAEINSGGSVATFAWDSLRFMGITDIYTLGLDLSYPIHIPHSRGCVFEEKVYIHDTKINSAETQLHKNFYNDLHIQIANHNNDMVISDKRLQVYHEWFRNIHTLFPDVHTYSFYKKAAQIPFITCLNLEDLQLSHMREKINNILKNVCDKNINTCSHKKNAAILKHNAKKLYTDAIQYSKILSSLINAHQNNKSTSQQYINEEQKLSSPEFKEVSDIIGFFIQEEIHKVMQYSPTSNTREHNNKPLYSTMYKNVQLTIKLLKQHFNL